MKRSLTLATALAVAGLLAAAPASAKTYRLSLSSWGSPKHPQVTQFVPQFTKMVTKKSDGRIRFRVFEGGEMVKEEFVATAVPQDTVDISLTVLDTWAGRIPDVSITTSPLWTKSMEETRDQLLPGHPIFDYFDKQLRSQGAVLLSIFDIGPAVVTTTFKLEKPSDLRGKSLRVYSKGAGRVIQALGGSPVTMGVGDVYSALQRGTVDGAMGGLQGTVGLKYYEVGKELFVPNGALGTLIHAYVMNKEKFESLPPDLQKIITESATAARNHMQQYIIDKYGAFIQVVADHGVPVKQLHKGTPEWGEWQKALSGLAQEAEKTYPAPLVKLIR